MNLHKKGKINNYRRHLSLKMDDFQLTCPNWRCGYDYIYLFIRLCCKFVLFNVPWKLERNRNLTQ